MFYVPVLLLQIKNGRRKKKLEKIKYNSSFYRKCVKTRENILGSTPPTTTKNYQNLDVPQEDILPNTSTESTATDEGRGKGPLEECISGKFGQRRTDFPSSVVWTILKCIEGLCLNYFD